MAENIPEIAEVREILDYIKDKSGGDFAGAMTMLVCAAALAVAKITPPFQSSSLRIAQTMLHRQISDLIPMFARLEWGAGEFRSPALVEPEMEAELMPAAMKLYDVTANFIPENDDIREHRIVSLTMQAMALAASRSGVTDGPIGDGIAHGAASFVVQTADPTSAFHGIVSYMGRSAEALIAAANNDTAGHG